METVSYKNTPRAVGNARLVSTDPSTTPTTTTATPPRHLHLDSPPPNSKPDMEGDLQVCMSVCLVPLSMCCWLIFTAPPSPPPPTPLVHPFLLSLPQLGVVTPFPSYTDTVNPLYLTPQYSDILSNPTIL